MRRNDEFDKLVLNALPIIRKFAKKLDWPNHEDLVHDTVLKAIENAEKFKEGTNIVAWLSTILFNTFSIVKRRSVKVSYTDEDFILNSCPQSPNQLVSLQLKEVLNELAKLPEYQRNIIFLYAEGFTSDEISERIGVHPKTVRSRISRVKQLLRDLTI